MKRVFLWPAALLALASFAVAAPAQSQNPAGGPGGADPNVVQPVKPASTRAGEMQEDVEILRRLLDDAFLKSYGYNSRKPLTPAIQFFAPADAPPAVDLGFPAQPPGVDHPALHTEGVYLKDYGVVYTVTLPPTGFDPLPGSDAGTGGKAPPDDWDRIRKEIRGETPTPDGKVVPGHQPLSEVILKVLADNGKHFGDLADGERISVAVTFRGAANCANCHQNPWPAAGQPPAPYRVQIPYSGGTSWTAPQAGVHYGSVPPGGTEPPDASAVAPAQAPGALSYLTDARNAILLGDLHLKQGKTKEAIEAYMKAADQIGRVIAHESQTEPGLRRQDVPALLTAVDLCNKLATAYVQDGNADAAGGWLKKSADFAKQAEQFTGVTTTANPAPAALPAKLVVTASKKQLDDIGSGKMTFEAFCKAATVEYVNPPAEKK